MNINMKDILVVTGLALAIMVIPRLGHALQDCQQQSIPVNGFTLVNTDKYVIQVPAGWAVGKETPWGARDITPKSGKGKMGAMTAGPTQANWAELFETSMYFIQREEPGTPTAIREGKTKLGYESASFEVINKKGFASRRYALLRDGSGNVLALSIKIPSPADEEALVKIFRHMVDTAKLKS